MGAKLDELRKRFGSKRPLRARRAVAKAEPGEPQRRRKRIPQAWLTTGSAEIVASLGNCQRGQYCSSFFCDECRQRFVASFGKKVLAHAVTIGSVEKQRERLRYVTVLSEVTSTSEELISDVLSSARRKLKAVRRKYPTLWIHGSFELEGMYADLANEN